MGTLFEVDRGVVATISAGYCMVYTKCGETFLRFEPYQEDLQHGLVVVFVSVPILVVDGGLGSTLWNVLEKDTD